MNPASALWRGLAPAVLVTAVLSGCSPGQSAPVPPPSAVTASTTAGAPSTQTGGRRRGSDGDGEGPPTLPAPPADWPADVPVPPGKLQGSRGVTGARTVLLKVPGKADDVLTAAETFYESHGFTRTGSGQLRKVPYSIAMVARNRDHSATQTDLTISLEFLSR
ncbi:hypothetical protein ACFUTU_04120 [Arthrobacter sp. NPDC057388]|uniref:hypothetical protein n=1 Tax=Arthrobacter sp. NPDC057388 TaxID=3346116 RepID=UPI00363D932E